MVPGKRSDRINKREYCKKLITVVGKDGGFILCPGCTMPMNAKHENVKAMFESVKNMGVIIKQKYDRDGSPCRIFVNLVKVS